MIHRYGPGSFLRVPARLPIVSIDEANGFA